MSVFSATQAKVEPKIIADPSEQMLRPGAPRQALSYWNRRRGDRDMPSRADLDPAEISTLLPNIFLVDVLPGESRYRYRLIGTRIAAWSGDDATGREMDDPRCGEGSGPFIAMHDEVVQSRAPLATLNRPALFDGSMLLFDRILLPLAGEDGRVAMILGAADATPAEG